MDLGLRGKAVIVTGASKGIGRAIARGFAEEGASLAICARGREALDAAAAELRERGAKVHASTCDVADPAALDAFLEGAREALGRVDVLVNNPSAFALGDDEQSWKTTFDVDLFAPVRASWKVIPWMEAAGGGVVIHIASTSGKMAGSPPAYAAMKAAMISHAKTISAVLAPKKIRVNTVAPGSIEFPGGFWDVVRQQNRPMYDSILATIPSGRMGTAEEVANVVVFLSSDRASWITGVTLGVDGGQYPANA